MVPDARTTGTSLTTLDADLLAVGQAPGTSGDTGDTGDTAATATWSSTPS